MWRLTTRTGHSMWLCSDRRISWVPPGPAVFAPLGVMVAVLLMLFAGLWKVTSDVSTEDSYLNEPSFES
jgi:hypothetical protein